MNVSPLKFELLGFRALPGRLDAPIGVSMKIEHQWEIAEDSDELSLTLMVTVQNNDNGEELAFAAVLGRYAVEELRTRRNALPEALNIWIGHSCYDVIRGVFLAHAEDTVLQQIMLPLAPDEAFLPESGLRSISTN